MNPPELNQEYARKSDLIELRKEINQDFKQHIEVLLERYSDQTQLLAEQHQETNKRLAAVEQKQDMLIETVGAIQIDIAEITDKLDSKIDRTEFENRLRPLEAQL